jgi:hypothetical protein
MLAPEDPAVTRQGEGLESQLLSRLAEPPLASAAVPALSPIQLLLISLPFSSRFADLSSRVADKEKRKSGYQARYSRPYHHNVFSLDDRRICIRTSV